MTQSWGKPDELFFLPQCSRVEDQLRPVSATQVDNIVPQYDLVNPTLDNDHQEYFKYVFNLQGLSAPLYQETARRSRQTVLQSSYWHN